jgi:myo-inositol catabolism protein IolC
MTIGFDQPLYILPFDQRESFQTKMFGWEGTLSAAQTAAIAAAKQVIYDGFQGAGVEPDVWKVEGMDRREDCVNLVAPARRDDRERVGCIILGGGEDERKVREWLATAATVSGFIGFAVGHTTFWDPLVDWRTNRIAREAAVTEIARRYREWVDLFRKPAKNWGAMSNG